MAEEHHGPSISESATSQDEDSGEHMIQGNNVQYELRTPLQMRNMEDPTQAIRILQEQIGLLKGSHLQKDDIIMQLQAKLQLFQTQRQLTDQIRKQANQIEGLKTKMSGEEYPLPKLQNPTLFSRQSKSKKFMSRRIAESDTSDDEYDQKEKGKSKQVKELEKTLKNYEETIKELRSEIMNLSQVSKELRKECSWMTKFIKKHIEMTQQISGVFREKVIASGWGLRKKAKESWRYVKHVFGYVLDPQE